MGRFEVRVCGARNIGDVQKVSLPDPYVKVKLGDEKKSQVKFKTRIIDNNLNPVWDELFKFQIADYDSEQVIFEVWNDNVFKDDVLGCYRLSVNGLTRGVMQDAWVILTSTKLASAELHIRVLAVDFGLEPQPGQKVYPSIEAAEAAAKVAVSEVRKKGQTGGQNTLAEVGGFAGQQQTQQQTVYGQPVELGQIAHQPQHQVPYVQQPLPQQPQVVYVQYPQPQQVVYVQQPQVPPSSQPQQYYHQGPPPTQPMYHPNPVFMQPPPPSQRYDPPPIQHQWAQGVPPGL